MSEAKAPTTIAETLAHGDIWVSTTAGTSMWPMLRNRRDTIVVAPATKPLSAYDVALYIRASDDAYILHRVIDRTPGGYVILGDNCINVEQVTESQVIGVLTEFWRGERKQDPHSPFWMAYARVWHALWPIRRIVQRLPHPHRKRTN